MTPEPAAIVRQGDALTILTGLPDASADAVITDPPYSSGGRTPVERKRSTRTKYTTGRRGDLAHELPEFTGDSRDQRSWAHWCALWLTECYRLTLPGGSVLMSCDWRQEPSAADAIQAAGWTWRGVVVWAKSPGRARPVPGGFRAQAEFWVWGTKGPTRTDHRVFLPGVITATAPHAGQREHPTEKPASLMQTLVQVAPPGGLVLDPFSGAGTTLAAALAEGRRAIGVELDPHWVRVARDRVARALAAPPLAM